MRHVLGPLVVAVMLVACAGSQHIDPVEGALDTIIGLQTARLDEHEASEPPPPKPRGTEPVAPADPCARCTAWCSDCKQADGGTCTDTRELPKARVHYLQDVMNGGFQLPACMSLPPATRSRPPS